MEEEMKLIVKMARLTSISGNYNVTIFFKVRVDLYKAGGDINCAQKNVLC